MRESRTYGSVRAKAEWLSYSTNLGQRAGPRLTDGGGPRLLDRNGKHLDIDRFAYLRDVLRRLPAHPADQLDKLLPDVWFASHPSARRKAAA